MVEDSFDPVDYPELYSGVLARRSLAFLFDAFMISVLTVVGWTVMFILGIFTLGLLWLAMGLVFPAVALCYTGFTLGGEQSATPGMRLMGLEMRQLHGAPMFVLLAMAHAVLFWVSVAVLTPLVLLVALFSGRKQLAHDLLLGTVVINS